MKHKTLTDNISIESILEFTKARHIDKDIVVVENIHNIPKIDTPRRMGIRCNTPYLLTILLLLVRGKPLVDTILVATVWALHL